MFIIYDLIFFIFILFSIPCLLIKRKLHKNILRRFYLQKGIVKVLEGQGPIWIHAVSVGEVMAIKRFVGCLKKQFNKPIVLSTITPTGNKLAKDIFSETGLVIYLPLDLSFIVKHFINRIRPCIFIVVETEIWPNLTCQLKRNNIPIIIVNARISDESFKGYKLIRPLLRPILKRIDIFSVQSKLYADRIISLGAEKEKVKITGNVKFDNTDYTDRITDYRAKTLLGLGEEEKLWVCASTHSGEERIILEVYKQLLYKFSNLRLLIAPRHTERTLEIEKLISRYNFQSLRISQIKQESALPAPYKSLRDSTGPAGRQAISSSKSIFILDTIGKLLSFYSIADIVFVGGSLVKKGGHNIIEPAIFEKPIIFGPFMSNFKDISELFLDKKAAVLVENALKLKEAVEELLTDSNKRQLLGKAAREVIDENKGATEKNIELIRNIL